MSGGGRREDVGGRKPRRVERKRSEKEDSEEFGEGRGRVGGGRWGGISRRFLTVGGKDHL